MDVVKTKYQVLPLGSFPGGTAQLSAHIKQTQGWKGLTVGWAPTLYGYFLQGACKFGIYEYLKDQASKRVAPDTLHQYKLPVYAAASAVAETVGSTLLTPWEAVRIRQVSKPDYAPSMLGVFSRMHREEGMKGLYRGLIPILGKQVPYTMTQLVSFQYVSEAAYSYLVPMIRPGLTKEKMSSQAQLVVSASSGVAAGVISAICSHPSDTILSRVNMAHKAGDATSLRDIVKELGFTGLWKGIGLRCVMVGTISAGMFLIFDGVKVLTGLPTTAGLGKK